MPSLPPEGGPARDQEPHEARHIAESFGIDAERYDRTRPRYPDALLRRIIESSPGLDFLDVGCGTGIVARQLQQSGCRVLGVEVDARMAGYARERGSAVEVSSFESWEPAGRSFDAIVAGQTWHWIDPSAGAAQAARILRPGGRLAVFWNVQVPPAGLAAQFNNVYRRVLPNSPWAAVMPGLQTYSPILDRAVDGIRAAGVFGEAERWRFDWQQRYGRAEWLDQVPTFGGHGAIAPDDLNRLLDGIGAVIDAAGGGFEMTYAAVAITAVRVV